MKWLWSKIYRLTGWYSPFARVKEYDALEKAFPEFFRKESVSIFIGCWQADSGITRRVKIK